MRFTDYKFTPGRYRMEYLDYMDKFAPQVKTFLKELGPTYIIAKEGYPYLEDQFGYMIEDERNKPGDDARYVRQVVKEWYCFVDRRFRPEQGEDVTVKAILDLVSAFQEFISKYSLNTHWLRYGLFRMLGKLTYDPHPYDHMWRALLSYRWVIMAGEPLEFHYEGWNVQDPSEKFKSKIMKDFEAVVDAYILTTGSDFQKNGYKRAKKPDLSLVKWLVYWNVHRTSKEHILQMITDDDPAGDRVITKKTLNAHFRRFKNEYDLPLRTG